MDEIHAPTLVRALRSRYDTSVQAHVLASAHPHAQLQAFQAIKPAHPLFVYWPALTPEHHVDPLVANSDGRSPGSSCAQCRLILCGATPIPCRPGQSCQLTRPNHGDLKLRVHPGRQFPPPRRPHSFFRTASDKMCLSKVRSATNRFSRAFSSRSCRSSLTSVIPRLP